MFSPSDKYDGIRPVNVYLMRLIFALMCFVMGKDVWYYIFSHSGNWNENEAIAWSVWAGFSVMALLGLFRTVAMIPVLILEIIYKVIWLALYAWPLIRDGKLEGSGSEETVFAFMLVILPIIAVPWGYARIQLRSAPLAKLGSPA